MASPGTFTIQHRDTSTRARIGVLHTAHGAVETPVFMPVGTQATVKSLTPAEVAGMGYDLILGNTYHLFLRPGPDIVAAAGGLHRFMGWEHAILTDSGGYQVFSLARMNKISAAGVEFRSHINGDRHFLGPVEAMAVQRKLGSDMAMVFDECIPYPAEKAYARQAVDRTLAWAETCREQARAPGQLVFGIGQGGEFEDLRASCAEKLVAMNFDGYAVGGVSVGEPEAFILRGIDHSVAHFPEEKPRYVMGLGEFKQILEAVSRGVDMFDCVTPTRYARNGNAFTRTGRLTIRNSRFKEDFSPIEPGCACYACTNFSRAYIRHLLNAGEMLGPRLLTLHNLQCFKQFIEDIKQAIRDNRLEDFKQDFLARYNPVMGRTANNKQGA